MNTFSFSSYCFSFTELWAVQIAGEASTNTQMRNSCRHPWFNLYCIHTNCPIAAKSGSQIAILKLGKPSKGFTCSLICIWLTCLTAWLTRCLTHSYFWDFKWCHSSCWGCQRKSCCLAVTILDKQCVRSTKNSWAKRLFLQNFVTVDFPYVSKIAIFEQNRKMNPDLAPTQSFHS